MHTPLLTPVRMMLIGARHGAFGQAAEMARQAGARVTIAEDEDAALAHLRRGGGDLVMIDVALDVPLFVSRLHTERIAVPVLACGIDASAERAVAAVRGGARDYLPLPPQRELIAAAIMSVAQRPNSLICESAKMKRAIQYGISMAASAAPILLRGEAGTGKSVLAAAIHGASSRRGDFVLVECQGIAPEILESELFGHETGAFSGAVARRVGRLEEAAEGTVYLRGIDALCPALQARLLEHLQSGHLLRIGGKAGAHASANLVASSTNDLRLMVQKGDFRADLLARLGLVEIVLPPLRDRPEDIDPLARHFAEEIARGYGMRPRHLSDEAASIVRQYIWPGNVRELEEVVHRAILLAPTEVIDVKAIVHADGSPLAERIPTQEQDPITVNRLVGHTVAEVERELILQTLSRCGGNRTSASSILGISVRTMRNKLKSFVEAGVSVSAAP